MSTSIRVVVETSPDPGGPWWREVIACDEDARELLDIHIVPGLEERAFWAQLHEAQTPVEG